MIVDIGAHGNTVIKTHLLLNTGANVTTIFENLPARLGLGIQQTRPGASGVADGRIVPIRLAIISRLSVGRKNQQNALFRSWQVPGMAGRAKGCSG